MLDGLLGRGFAAKCKSLIKLTKSRIEVIRRKRNATLKFLKKDMADLLAHGLDINAYGRAEGLLAELTMSSCYDLVEQYCDFVLRHITVLQKMRHCPEDCKEAVSSLMFAAARFSDLPELRDLRDIFYERYEKSVELFVNQEFVEKLSSKPFIKEKKVDLMQKIAEEFSLGWDSRAFSLVQDQPKVRVSSHSNEDANGSTNGRDAIPRRDKQDASLKEGKETINASLKGIYYSLHDDKEKNVPKRNDLYHEFRHEVSNDGNRVHNFRENMISKKDNHDRLPQVRQEDKVEKREPWKEDAPLKVVRPSSSQRKRTDGGSEQHQGGENIALNRDTRYTTDRKPDFAPTYEAWFSKNDGTEPVVGSNYYGSQHNVANPTKHVQVEVHTPKPYYNNAIPPPYTKPNGKLKDINYEIRDGSSHLGSEINGVLRDPASNDGNDARNRSGKVQGAYDTSHEFRNVEHMRANGHGHGHGHGNNSDAISNPIPKPRSSRRRHSKSHSKQDDGGNMEDIGIVKRRARSRRKDDSRRGLQILFDDEHYRNDEEERMIDKLLMHYSKKPSATAHEPESVRKKSKGHPLHHQGHGADASPKRISRNEPEDFSSAVPHTARSNSFPHEQTKPSGGTKVFARAATFQADRSSPAKHVHPKLPDYDDLAARFAALKGR